MDEDDLMKEILEAEKKLREKRKEEEKEKDPLANVDFEKRKIIEEILKLTYFKITPQYIEYLKSLSIEKLKNMLEILLRRDIGWRVYYGTEKRRTKLRRS